MSFILIFVLLLSTVLWWLKYVLVLKRPDGITTMQNLYAQKEDSCDIILLGSSHVGMNLDCATLWEEQGYASYALWGSMQPFWNSYYYLKEALKTQSPQLVVLDAFTATYYIEYADTERQVTNLVGMRMGINRLMATVVSSPPDKWINLLLEYPIFHSRIEELTADDFNHFPWSKDLIHSKGTDTRFGSSFAETVEMPESSELGAIHPKQERYLRKIIELCHENDIELLLIKTPVIDRAFYKPYMNSVQLIADEYELPFVDINALDAETGLCSSDNWLDGWHLNTNGARKVSSWLGSYIRSNYNIPDHRGDPDYASWDVFSENMQKEYLGKILLLEDYITELRRAGYPVLIVRNDNGHDAAYQNVHAEIQRLGIGQDHSQSTAKKVIYIPDQAEPACNVEYDFSQANGEENGVYFGDIDCYVEYTEGMIVTQNDATLFADGYPGVFLLVFDPVSKECVDCVSLHRHNSYAVVHNPIA